ncbi:MAG: acyl-CoA thioesterase [Stellaceae bacterium]
MAPAGRLVIERAFPPRTYDIDFAGVVGNTVYIRWLEDLRLALMEGIYPIERALADDIAPVLLSTNIVYEKPVTIRDPLVGRMWVPAIERLRWHVAAEFSVGENVHARAKQVGIFIRLSTRRPVPPPEPLRAHYLPPP